MISQSEEYVPLSTPIQISDDVEIWLKDLEKAMRETLDLLLKKTLQSQQGLDIVNTPSQVCCLAEQIHFSNNCQQAIQRGKLSNYKQDLSKQLESYTKTDNQGNNILFLKIKALILDIIHSIDVVDQLCKDQISQSMNINDWQWFK
jgi:dynein heavy chain 2